MFYVRIDWLLAAFSAGACVVWGLVNAQLAFGAGLGLLLAGGALLAGKIQRASGPSRGKVSAALLLLSTALGVFLSARDGWGTSRSIVAFGIGGIALAQWIANRRRLTAFSLLLLACLPISPPCEASVHVEAGGPPGAPIEKPEVPEQLVLRVGEELVKLDFAEWYPAPGTGDDAVFRVRMFVDGTDAAEVPIDPLAPIAPAASTPDVNWVEALVYSVVTDGRRLRVGYEAGDDSFLIETSLDELSEQRGTVFWNWNDRWQATSVGVVPGHPAADVRATGFPGAKALVLYSRTVGWVGERFDVSRRASCAPEAFGCAGALLVNGGTLVSVVLACGGTPLSGGALTPACIGSFIAHNGAMYLALNECAELMRCLRPRPPGGPGDPAEAICVEPLLSCCGGTNCCAPNTPPELACS